MHRFSLTAIPWRRLLWLPLRPTLNKRLGLAIRLGDARLAALLLDRGANPNALLPAGFTPLTINHTRSDSQCAALAHLLLSRGALPNLAHASGMKPLHYAALFALPILCRTLIDAGADARARDASGLTPGERAQRFGRSTLAELQAPELVRAELERGELVLGDALTPLSTSAAKPARL